MKSMKGATINRMLGSLKRRSSPTSPTFSRDPNDDSPEATAVRNVVLFCESGTPGRPGESDEEVLYLPLVVDACESSPSAAKEAAHIIQKFLSKENFNRPHLQYNSVMLIRILAENPGPTFTRNFDAKFVHTVKELLRFGPDQNIRNFLVETLNKFLRDKAYYEGIELIVEMWVKEQEKMRRHGQSDMIHLNRIPTSNFVPMSYPPSGQVNGGLPSSQELSMRIVEACTSAQLLTEVTNSTRKSEILNNDLIQELANRCQNANLSIQKYISAKDPAPENNIMETLIETNELINKALSSHQRAILQARKALEKRPTLSTASSSASSERVSFKSEGSRVSSGNENSRSPERKNGSSTPEFRNPFTDSRNVLNKKPSSSVSSEGKYMMHAGGSDIIPDGKKKYDTASRSPVYRY